MTKAPPPPPGFGDTPPPPPGFIDPPVSSATGAALRHAGAGALPAVGGAIGFGGGFAAGGTLAAPTAAFSGPIGPAIGAVGGGLLGAFGGGYIVKKAQDKVLSLLPTRVVRALGQDPAQVQADETQHPYASFAGDLAPGFISMRPGLSANTVEEGASKLTKFLAHPVGSRVAGATVSAAPEVAHQIATGQFDSRRLALAATEGAILNHPTKFGAAAFQAGGNAAIRAMQTGARVASSTVDAGASVLHAAKDAADLRSGALIEGDATDVTGQPLPAGRQIAPQPSAPDPDAQPAARGVVIQPPSMPINNAPTVVQNGTTHPSQAIDLTAPWRQARGALSAAIGTGVCRSTRLPRWPVPRSRSGLLAERTR